MQWHLSWPRWCHHLNQDTHLVICCNLLTGPLGALSSGTLQTILLLMRHRSTTEIKSDIHAGYQWEQKTYHHLSSDSLHGALLTNTTSCAMATGEIQRMQWTGVLSIAMFVVRFTENPADFFCYCTVLCTWDNVLYKRICVTLKHTATWHHTIWKSNEQSVLFACAFSIFISLEHLGATLVPITVSSFLLIPILLMLQALLRTGRRVGCSTICASVRSSSIQINVKKGLI